MKKNTIALSASVALMISLTSAAVADSNGGDKEASSTQISGWINTRVPHDISAKELALRYYGDESDYMIIVDANKGIIGKDLIVKKNTEVKIPITPKFTDQPEILGWE